MSNAETSKLKRGLKDLSPLFAGPSEETHQVKPPSPDILKHSTVISVICPGALGDSLFYNTFVASNIATREKPSTIVSISVADSLNRGDAGSPHFLSEEKYGDFLTRIPLSWNEFLIGCLKGLHRRGPDGFEHQTFFLDFEYSGVPDLFKVMPILDKVVLLIRPTFEGLSEAYKIMKTCYILNHDIEFFILHEGKSGDPVGSAMYEAISEMASKHLGIHTIWLGCMDSSEGLQRGDHNLAMDHLVINNEHKIDTPEKLAFINFIQLQFRRNLESFS